MFAEVNLSYHTMSPVIFQTIGKSASQESLSSNAAGVGSIAELFR